MLPDGHGDIAVPGAVLLPLGDLLQIHQGVDLRAGDHQPDRFAVLCPGGQIVQVVLRVRPRPRLHPGVRLGGEEKVKAAGEPGPPAGAVHVPQLTDIDGLHPLPAGPLVAPRRHRHYQGHVVPNKTELNTASLLPSPASPPAPSGPAAPRLPASRPPPHGW